MKTAPAAIPRFFWQGVLIVLPVAVLAFFALFSLRQDRVMVDHEAREKALAEASEIASRLWATLEEPNLRAVFQEWRRSRAMAARSDEPGPAGFNPAFLFQVDPAGRLIFPPPVQELPEPHPLDFADLDDQQAVCWRGGQMVGPEFQANPANAIGSLRRLIALAPPDPFVAAARFQLGLLLGRDHQPEEAAREFQSLVESFPRSSGESGLPLPPLALLKAAEQIVLLTNSSTLGASALLDAACSNALSVPSSVTPLLLRAALPIDSALSTNLAARWEVRWREQQVARALHAAALPAFRTALADAVRRRTKENAGNLPLTPAGRPLSTNIAPRLFWFALPNEFPAFCLASRIDNDIEGSWYLCRPRFGQHLGARYDALGSAAASVVPSVFSISAETNALRSHPSPPPEYAFLDRFLVELEKQRAQLPGYFGLSLELAGRSLISTNDLPAFSSASGHKGGPYEQKSDSVTAPPLLASAVHIEDGVESLRVGVHLVNPSVLYARQRARTNLFGLLIGASALAAVIGFASARRAFRRQQQLAEMKSNFVSSVSHELRAPIASVRLMAESLERGKIAEPAKQREYFRFIVQECRRLGTLIENVLDFARIEQGRKQYGFEPTDLVALVRQTVQLMEPAAHEREVALEFIAPDSSQAAASLQPVIDGAALQQALVNLVDNAIKHSPPHTAVTVALGVIAQPPSITLSVQDRGPGIPAAEHGKIFERFYRRGSELRRETQGVGIGLSIVQHVVAAHGGCVRVESALGQGSRFVIELPANLEPVKK